MSKPTVFNYQDYVKLRKAFADLTAKHILLAEENKRLRDHIANLEIRCRIAEDPIPDRQGGRLKLKGIIAKCTLAVIAVVGITAFESIFEPMHKAILIGVLFIGASAALLWAIWTLIKVDDE